MPDALTETIENEIVTYGPPLELRCDWADEVIWPRYDGLSFANIPATIARLLGTSLPDDHPLDSRLWEPFAGTADKLIVVLLDGVGYRLLGRLRAKSSSFDRLVRDAIGDGIFAPITSVFPSTTVTALGTLWTGKSPAQHGLLGTIVLLREYGVLANLLYGSPAASERGRGTLRELGFNAETFLKVPSLAGLLARAGIETHVVIAKPLFGSGLSKMFHRQVRNGHTFVTDSDMWVRIDRLLDKLGDRKACIMAYWGAVDSLSHHEGVNSPYTLAEVRHQWRELYHFTRRRAGRDGRTLLMVIADHGLVDTFPDHELSIVAHLDLSEVMRMPFGGEERASYFYVRHGFLERALDFLRSRWPERVLAIDSAQALRAGLFGWGPPMGETPARIGDLVVVSREGTFLTDWANNVVLKAQHGGLSRDEMLVPYLLRRL